MRSDHVPTGENICRCKPNSGSAGVSDRAIITAKLIDPRPILCIFVAVDSNTVDLNADNKNISKYGLV